VKLQSEFHEDYPFQRAQSERSQKTENADAAITVESVDDVWRKPY
jgi:hypothetical protein